MRLRGAASELGRSSSSAEWKRIARFATDAQDTLRPARSVGRLGSAQAMHPLREGKS